MSIKPWRTLPLACTAFVWLSFPSITLLAQVAQVAPGASKTPAPDKAAQDSAYKLVADIFGDDLAKRPIPQAIMMGLARAAQNAEAVSCDGSLDVTRYGGVLQARRPVGVRGAGPAFDGLYYVKSVTSKLKKGAITQDFLLTRNAFISITPVVPA